MKINKTDIAVGIDIGGTNTDFGFVDLEGNCFYKSSLSTGKFLRAGD
jgi:predicted NBD/HSP70 family sugar kinase